ncbi:DNA cytosine methyltransferase [Teredinibacter purpureus]|uniref:DNA cytosine methyltransferase n=1 Tax=Teredinibacter purpureus TaxID=2731756 RepID=UPI00069765D6|nr:DNA cytosine methyltransferase [Teredinibacter purpureus]
MHFLQHSYTKVAPHRGKKRIWLQGLRLSDCGFDKGSKYRVDYDEDYGFIELILDEDGSRLVSGKKQGEGYSSIVDICNEEVVTITKGQESVRVDYAKGYIRISIHHHASKRIEREKRLKQNAEKNSIKKASLCSGIGVAALALHQGLSEMGVNSNVSWVVDRESKYLQIAKNNNPILKDAVIYESSLEELEPNLLEPVDLLQVSLPCTGHSKSGKTKNKSLSGQTEFIAENHATDATAVFGLMRVIEHVNPAIIVSENVVDAKNSATYCLIKGMLELLGYGLLEVDLDAKQAGSFEKRTRYWLIATSIGLNKPYIDDIPVYERQYRYLTELIENTDMPDSAWSDNQYLKDKAVRDDNAGKGFKRNLVSEVSTSINCIGRHYMKRRSTEPMITRVDGKERLLSPVEHSRAKGIPETLIENTAATLAHEGLGQSILFNHARGIGCMIAKNILNPLLSKTGNNALQMSFGM